MTDDRYDTRPMRGTRGSDSEPTEAFTTPQVAATKPMPTMAPPSHASEPSFASDTPTEELRGAHIPPSFRGPAPLPPSSPPPMSVPGFDPASAPYIAETKVFVAPDGSPIQSGVQTSRFGFGSRQFPPGYPQGSPPADPSASASRSLPPRSASPHPSSYPYATAPASSSPFAASVVAPNPGSHIRVGLLVWGVVLMIAGLATIMATAFGGASFQGLIVVLFALAGIAFLYLAYRIGKQSEKEPESNPYS